MRLGYVDASALFKLIVGEPESDALQAELSTVELVSCELVLTEIPRAIRRAGSFDRRLLDALMAQANAVLEAVSLVPLDRPLLAAAGALEGPDLRTLDAIHVMAAIDVSPVDAFVTYDRRQADAARRAGLPTLAPA